MAKWNEGSTYPDRTTLTAALDQRIREKRTSLVKYSAATAALAIAIWWITGQALIVFAAIPFLAAILTVVCIRERQYRLIATAVRDGAFRWTSGPLEGKYQRSIMEMNATPKYQVRCNGQWMGTDAVTFIECETGSPVVMVECDGETVGIPVPKKISCVKREKVDVPLLSTRTVS